VLGRVYEYFLSQFAGSEGKRGGEFYTPRSVVRVMVEMLEPYKGRVYDPCCGSRGMFVQSERFAEEQVRRECQIFCVSGLCDCVSMVSALLQESGRRTEWQIAPWQLSIQPLAATVGQHFLSPGRAASGRPHHSESCPAS
jgi:hypothetical protein